MQLTRTLLAAGLLGLMSTFAAQAAETKDVPKEVNGVRLSRLCDQCGVVTSVRQETRKGKGSGVGALGGAVAGGVVGNKTTDSTVGTVGGAVLGGVIGQQIERQVKKRKVWATRVTLKDGTVRKFDTEANPGWRAGTVVEVDADKQLRRR